MVHPHFEMNELACRVVNYSDGLDELEVVDSAVPIDVEGVEDRGEFLCWQEDPDAGEELLELVPVEVPRHVSVSCLGIPETFGQITHSSF